MLSETERHRWVGVDGGWQRRQKNEPAGWQRVTGQLLAGLVECLFRQEMCVLERCWWKSDASKGCQWSEGTDSVPRPAEDQWMGCREMDL